MAWEEMVMGELSSAPLGFWVQRVHPTALAWQELRGDFCLYQSCPSLAIY